MNLALKVDVDTERGTRVGLPNLLRLFDEFDIRATILFSLGPDNTGRAIKRIFRPGFLRKVRRTDVVGVYGLRTLLNGVLLPGPHIARRNAPLMRAARAAGHEVGIHCFDHVRWQDGLARMSAAEVCMELARARTEFERVFGAPARTAGAAGWQANALSLEAYDAAGFDYASDARGRTPFLPRVGTRVFATPQIPTTLPTLDELLGRPEYPDHMLVGLYRGWLRADALNVLTVHAEIEGMAMLAWFRGLLASLRMIVRFVTLGDVAATLERAALPVCELLQGEIDGRSGTLAVQGVCDGRQRPGAAGDSVTFTVA